MKSSTARGAALCLLSISNLVFAVEPTGKDLSRFFVGNFSSENSHQLWVPNSSNECDKGCIPSGISATVSHRSETDTMTISVLQDGKVVYSCNAQKDGADETEYESFIEGEGFCQVEIETKGEGEIGVEIEVPWNQLEIFRKFTEKETSDFRAL